METDREYVPVKESKGWYFTEYRPPIGNSKFATLNLVITTDAPLDKVAVAMEEELIRWLKRYPIPLLVFSFDNIGDLIKMSEIKGTDCVIGFIDELGIPQNFWGNLKDDEIPNIALDKENTDKLFSKLVFKTHAELKTELTKRRKKIKAGWYIFVIWLVIIPIAIAFLEYYSDLLSLVALIYSVYKAIQKLLELIGKNPKTKKEKETEHEEQLKEQYYFHCQMNPEGFERLKLENLKKIAKDEIQKEVLSLNGKKV